MTIGPIQLLVIGFDEARFRGEILPEIERLRDRDVIRVVDVLVLRRDGDGELERLAFSDLGVAEQREFGAIAGALIGFGADGDEGAVRGAVAGAESPPNIWDDADEFDVAAALLPGEAVALALIEHRWAIPLRGAIERAGGRAIADSWIQPADLVELGAEVAAQLAELDQP